jgi:WD40 repeat protein
MNASKVHWARLLDEEHVLAFVDQDIACWNLVSGECLYTVRHHDPKVTPVLSGGKRYWVLPQSGSIRWYRSSDGESLGEVTLDKGTTPQVAFSPRGDQLAIVSGRRLRVWDLPMGKVTKQIEHRRPIGSNMPVWIDDQWVMTSNGLVFDLALERAVWQYDVIGANVSRVGNGIIVQRIYGDAEIDLLELPHPVAAEYLTSQPTSDDVNAIPKSKWNAGQWEE